jgi:tRNA A37 threonylcarbamoyladenosine synthetase subunit TsaC/SUA5/YrdC
VSGEKVCVNSDEVSFVFENKIEAIVEGVSGQQMASTIIDATQEKLKVLRQGKALLNEIEERLESEYGYRISV